MQSDYITVKISASGEILWKKKIGGDRTDLLSCAAETRNGSLILAGTSNSSLSRDKTVDTQGQTDFWVVKMITDEKQTTETQRKSWEIYPNPTERFVNVIIAGELKGHENIQVFDLSGKNHNPASGSFSVANAYNEKISYDKNGNILSMDRNGAQDISNNVTTIDLLSYTYLPGSNQLSTVRDRSNHLEGFAQKNTSGKDFEYDTNGNLILDAHKGISSISYNHLNLPYEIFFTSGNKISYLYDASGYKMQKTVTQNGRVTPTLYLGGFQYENNQLQFFPHSEGYFEYMKKQYVYNYTDHLGNVRLSYAQKTEF